MRNQIIEIRIERDLLDKQRWNIEIVKTFGGVPHTFKVAAYGMRRALDTACAMVTPPNNPALRYPHGSRDRTGGDVVKKEGVSKFLRDIVSHQRSPDSRCTQARLSCGHVVFLFGDIQHLVALYGKLATQCAECVNEYVRKVRQDVRPS